MPDTPDKTVYSRGTVVLVLFPNSDLLTAKRRPALVIQADQLDTGIDQLVIAMISSKLFRAGHPSRVLVEIGSEIGALSGLISDSVVMTDNLATVHVGEIDRGIGRIPMPAVDDALRHTLGLTSARSGLPDPP